MSDVEIISADQLRQSGAAADSAMCYLAALIERGPAHYLDNARVRMEALRIDGRVLPLVVSERVADNSNVCSVYAHYHQYSASEFARRFGSVRSLLLKPPRSLLGALFRIGSIDRIVYVNNWLLTTNPNHGLASAQIAAVTRMLTQRYPGSAIIFRSVNPMSDPQGLDALRTNHYRIVPSRPIYIVDTKCRRFLERSNFQADLARLKRTAYTIIEDPRELAPHAPRMAELYRELYLRKHSPLNPQYNREFFSMILEARFMNHRAFIKDGRVDAFFSYLLEDGVMTASLIAYDLAVPQKLALYRMGFALAIAEAAKRQMLLNLSAGAGEFKMLRGALPVQEYDAIYDRHLPMSRRLPWACLEAGARAGRHLSPPPQSVRR
ncbi:MAG TPA: hypothetical protein VKV03_07890 [Candidatus Binataceae bacterium]|nr:hypothetical protein [Candidatus Binataceae bacterium]